MVHVDNHYCSYPVMQLETAFWLLTRQTWHIHLHFVGVFVHTPSLRKPVLWVNASKSKQTQNIILSIYLFHRRFRLTAAKVTHFRPFQNLV